MTQASGAAPEDLESPLGEGVAEGLLAKFAKAYGYTLAFEDQLAEPILGRIKREIDRKTNTLLTVDKVRSAREASRPTRPKHVQLGGNIDLVVQGPRVARRDIKDIHEYQRALEMLLVSGYVVVGNFVPVGKSVLFSSLSAVKSYLSFVRQKCQGHFSANDLLSLVRASDEDTRCLWAESMRCGATLSEAMASCASKQEALWLWARASDVLTARAVVTPDGAEKRKRPLFEDEENEDRRKRQNKGDKVKGRGKGKGDERKKGGKGRRRCTTETRCLGNLREISNR